MLHCNVVSHWVPPYSESSLNSCAWHGDCLHKADIVGVRYTAVHYNTVLHTARQVKQWSDLELTNDSANPTLTDKGVGLKYHAKVF